MIKSRLLASSAIVAIALLTTFCYSGLLAAELTEIKERGKLIVAVKNNTRPLGFTDDEGNLTGLEIDIARRLAKDILGDENAVVLQPVNNKDRLKAVIDEEVDIAIARVSDTPSRRRIVDLSTYYYLDGTGIVTKDITVDPSNTEIAVLYDSETIAVVRDRFPDARLIGVSSYQEGLNSLETNQVRAFAADITVLTGLVQEYPQYKLLPERLSGAALSIVMPKGLQHKELQLAVERAISDWRESGWLQERIKYWGLP